MRMRKGQVGQVGQVGRVGRAGVALAAIALVAGMTGCKSASSTTAATTTVTRTTDTFTGTVQVGGSDFHSFPIATTGQVDVTLTAAAPPAAIVMGLSIGTLDVKCTPLAGASVKVPAGASAQLSGLASPGTLCVNVQDVGNQAAPVSYTVTVVHP